MWLWSDFVRGKLSYRGRTSKRLCKILMFPLQGHWWCHCFCFTCFFFFFLFFLLFQLYWGYRPLNFSRFFAYISKSQIWSLKFSFKWSFLLNICLCYSQIEGMNQTAWKYFAPNSLNFGRIFLRYLSNFSKPPEIVSVTPSTV